jgi:RHS repeat-associated protein
MNGWNMGEYGLGCSSAVTRTWEYNLLGQMTRMTARNAFGYSAPFDLSYTYSATANDGRIVTARDNIKNETVAYTYDLLGRLSAARTTVATLAPWGLAWVYDGFGNRVQQNVTQGSGPMVNLTVDGATNRITTAGYAYDANGNTVATPGRAFEWDGGDRMLLASGAGSYGYNTWNQRVWRAEGAGAVWTLYGAGGERIGEYDDTGTAVRTWTYFAGRPLGQTRDRVGSVVDASAPAGLSYFPYGEERVTRTADGSERFGTYQRDAGTGLDYAMNRYYSATVGRFVSPDPYEASGGTANPQSWNRYAYVQNDPADFSDPSGLVTYGSECRVDGIYVPCSSVYAIDGGSPGGGGGWNPCSYGNMLGPVPWPGCLPLFITPPNIQDAPDAFNSALVSTQRARDALGKKDCYEMLGFQSAQEAKKRFDGIKFNYVHRGRLVVRNNAPATRPAPADTLGYGTININIDYNWDDFSNVITSTGRTFDYLGFINRSAGTNLTSEQLGDLIIIHELRHQQTMPKPSDAEGAQALLEVYRKCIR